LIDNFTARGIQIINDTLFIVNDEEYILYSNPEITYEKLEYTEPYYSAYNESFYQVEYYEKTVLISIENNDTLRNVTIPREKGDTIIPVLKGLVYNPRQFAFKDKITPLNSGIDIYTAQNSLNSYDTFLRYNSSNQVEYIGLSDVHILNIINESGLTKYEIGEFEFYSDDEILISNTRNVIARYVFTAALFIIIPVVSYYSPIAILSFDEIAYKKSKKN